MKKTITENCEREDEKQLNSIDEIENFDQYKSKNTITIPFSKKIKD